MRMRIVSLMNMLIGLRVVLRLMNRKVPPLGDDEYDRTYPLMILHVIHDDDYV